MRSASAFLGASLVACTTSSSPPAAIGANGGPIIGAADTHCTATVAVKPSACTATDAGAPVDATADVAGDAAAEGGDPGCDFGVTMFNAEGDDDQCKYHIKWTGAGIAKGSDATFTVTLTNKVDNTRVLASPVRLEVFLNETHPAPNSNQKAAESPAGTYAVGPIKFDASGQWTVRFHFHEECVDAPESPHGHGAFFVQIP